MRTISLGRMLQAASPSRGSRVRIIALIALLAWPLSARAAGPEDEMPAVDFADDAEASADASPDGDVDEVEHDDGDGEEAVDGGDDDGDDGDEADDEADGADAEDEPSAPSKPKATSSKKRKATSSKSRSRSSRHNKSKLCNYRTPLHQHEVAEGEHLGSIAGRYGVSRKDLVELNPELKNPDLIRPGQKVKVCPELAPRTRREVVYEVKAGDKLLDIAKAHELSLDELLAQQKNPVSDPNLIRPGQKIVIELDGDILPGFEPEVARRYDRGSLHSSHRLPKGIGYAIKRPHLAFGTKSTVSTIKKVIDRYHRRADGGPLVHVGDISREGGGPLKGHVSHQRGVDVDIGLVLKGDKRNDLRFHGANGKNLDVRRTWILVHEFLKTGQVRYIFLDYRLQKLLYEHAKKTGVSDSELDEYFQYPRGRGRNYGIVRHWKGHRDHIHVRFRR